MKVVRTAALSRQEAPSFTALTDAEIIALRQVPAWMRWLFVELRAMSDFKTGLVYTSYARLAALLDCDQPERGRRLDTPTLKQIRTALDTLARMNLALRDRMGNEEKRELKILIPAIAGFGASNEKKGREKGRPPRPQNYDEYGAKRKPDTQIGQRSGQGVQDLNSLLPLPLHVDKLSPGEGRKKADALRASLVRPPGGGKGSSGPRAPQATPDVPHVSSALNGLTRQAPRGGGTGPPSTERKGRGGGKP